MLVGSITDDEYPLDPAAAPYDVEFGVVVP